MRIISFGRTIIVPVSVVVIALAGLSAPTVTSGSLLAVVAIAAIGLIALALTGRRHTPRPAAPLAPLDDALRIARDDASDLARMGSDAG